MTLNRKNVVMAANATSGMLFHDSDPLIFGQHVPSDVANASRLVEDKPAIHNATNGTLFHGDGHLIFGQNVPFDIVNKSGLVEAKHAVPNVWSKHKEDDAIDKTVLETTTAPSASSQAITYSIWRLWCCIPNVFISF